MIVQVGDVDRTNPDDLARIYVRGSRRRDGQLSNLVKIEERVAPKELNHFNKLRSATITATLGPGYTLGEATDLPDGCRGAGAVGLGGAGRLCRPDPRVPRDRAAASIVTFVLALAFIYLVLAAQFESFIDPFVIMLTVPLSITGALLALKLTGARSTSTARSGW